MSFEYYIYIFIAFVLCLFLIVRAKNKAFIGLFLFWLYGSPIFLNPNYLLSLNFLGIDIQPNRFLFIILTPVMFIHLLTRRRNLAPSGSTKSLKLYELLLVGYLFIIIIALIINIGSVGITRAIVLITNTITFILVYFAAKEFIKNNDYSLIQIAILIFALLSATLAFYQFFVNPEFFRLGSSRLAFSGFVRANGLFASEYDQGMFLIFSIVVVMSFRFPNAIKLFLITIFCAGIFLTMHRLSWIALIVTLALIWFLYFRRVVLTYIIVPLVAAILVIVALYTPWSQLAIGRFGTNLIAKRILADTLTVRVSQYQFSFDLMSEYPLGIGDYETAFYTQVAYSHGIDYVTANVIEAYIIHNGFLSAGVKYGILGLVVFSLYIVTSIAIFLRKGIQQGKTWYPPFMIMVIFLIFNLTNDFSYIGTQIGVSLAWLIGVYVAINLHQPIVDGNHQLIS